MDFATVTTDHAPISLLTKLNPLWWLVGPDGWEVPTVNNGEPYIPEVTNGFMRKFYWFICRNPLMNFVAFVMGVEDKTYTVWGPKPVLAVTWRDVVDPVTTGFKWALLHTGFSAGAAVVWAVCIVLWLFFDLKLSFVIAFIAFFKMIGWMPYISYWGPVFGYNFEVYLGWRPHNGGFGFKSVIHSSDKPVVDGKVIGT